MGRITNQQVYIVLSGWFIQIKQVGKAVPFYDPLERLTLKTLASGVVIRQFPCCFIMSSYICYIL